MSEKKSKEQKPDHTDWAPGKRGYSPEPSGKKPIPPRDPSAVIPVPEDQVPKPRTDKKGSKGA